MGRELRKKLLATLILLVTASFCPMLYQKTVVIVAADPEVKVLVDVLLDYGNGTWKWTSCVLSKPGNNTVYNATQFVATTLNVTWWDGDAFVDAIDDVWNSYPYYWMWWYWNSTEFQWVLGPTSCSTFALEDLDIVAWYYENVSTWPPEPPANPPTVHVDILLDYGNGTIRWCENVEVTGFTSVLKATKTVASVEYSLWGSDVFVDAIDGVWNNYGTNYFWLYWFWNHSAKNWEMGAVACNKHVLTNGDTIAWYYEDCTVWPPSSPPVTKVDILLDYRNDTRVWYENVELPGFPSVLKATKAVAFVEYTLWGTDAFVDAINNVWNSDPFYWIWWYWNHSAGCWESGPVACNKYMLMDGDILAWYYLDWHVWQPPSQTPHPTASFTWTPSIPKVGETITFDASASTPNGGIIVDYAWNFGDGSFTHGKIVAHTYSNPGTYTVNLNVTDSNGLWGIEQKQITVVQPHGPKADFKAIPETAIVGEKIKFDASSSLPGWNGTHAMPITVYVWNFGDGNMTTTTQPIIYHSYITAGNYYVTLTVRAPGATPEVNSTTLRVTVISIPVGGYSVAIKATEKPLMLYLLALVGLTAAFTAVNRKLSRRTLHE